MPVFRDDSQTNRTAENGLLGSEGGALSLCLRVPTVTVPMIVLVAVVITETVLLLVLTT